MKKLIIAEKPSVGRTIAAVLGAKDQKEGFIEGKDYIVSWGIGHLAELVNADSYDERYARWTRNDLPIVPANWKYKVPRDKFNQFTTVKQLMNRKDVSEIINACDAGREGELIFRNIYQLADCSKSVQRLWISSMEDAAIRHGFQNLKPSREYDHLFEAARCREWADWLVGINATRLFSVMYHRTLNVGRVVSPTLAILVQREAEIFAFTPETYYIAELNFGSFRAVSDRFPNKSDAEAALLAADGTAVVRSIHSKEKCEKAPALYDLTTLQREANRLLGYTAQQTLDYAQSLYEKKLCTYPRTDSRHLPDDMEEGAKALVCCASTVCGQSAPDIVLTGQVCDSQKVTDHHAIIPTREAGDADLSQLPVGEREILLMIARQVLRAFSENHRYLETSVVFDCGGYSYTAKGKSVKAYGWKLYDKNAPKETSLPEFEEGAELKVRSLEIRDGETKPPAHYTEDTLLSAMEAAGCSDMPDDAERTGLGTPATRSGIIEKLIAIGFVERRKGQKHTSLIPCSTGTSLITVLPEQLQSPLLTAEWEHKLKQVEHGEMDPDAFMADISLMVNDLVKTCQPIPGAEILFPSGREVIGTCPRCGSDVTESKKGFFCERNDCRFGLWRDNKFLAGKKISLNPKMVADLLKGESVPVKGIFSERTGRSYDASLTLSDDGSRITYALDFGEADGE